MSLFSLFLNIYFCLCLSFIIIGLFLSDCLSLLLYLFSFLCFYLSLSFLSVILPLFDFIIYVPSASHNVFLLLILFHVLLFRRLSESVSMARFKLSSGHERSRLDRTL